MARSEWDVAGRTVLITGAARGIGAATASALVARGANVVLVDMRPDEVQVVADRLGSCAFAVAADVTDQEALDAAVDVAVARFGGLDCVIANAGVAHLEPVATGDPAHFRQTLDVNLLGVWQTMRAALPHVRARRGYVLAVASVAAPVHPLLHGAYSATKAGVEALCDVLRTEVAHEGVDVGVAYFPYIDTPMVRDVFAAGVGKELESRLTYPLNRRIPVDRAADAMLAGVEGRARRVYTPRWVRLLLLTRGLLPRLVEAQNRYLRTSELIDRYEREQAAAAGSERASRAAEKAVS